MNLGLAPALTFLIAWGVVTHIDENESALVELKQMFNNKMYLNVFGDKPGFLSLSGFFAYADCSTPFAANGKPLYTGFEMLHYYYRQHKVSNRLWSIPILIGGMMSPVVYQAFLLGLNLRIADAQSPVGQFSMQFAYPIQRPFSYDYFNGLYVGTAPSPPPDSGSPGTQNATTSGLFLP